MTADQWRDLDERVRRLEERLASAGRVAEPDPTADSFWMLTELRRQLADVKGGGIGFAGAVDTVGGAAEWQYGLTTTALVAAADGTTESIAARLAALGHPIRLRLLLAVLDGHSSPAELAELDGVGTTGQVYHHVRTLTAAGWLRSAGRNRVEIPAERLVPLLVAIATTT